MKFRFFIPILLTTICCLAFNACQKEDLRETAQQYKTIISVRSTGTKTHYHSGSVIWDAGDQICVARGNTFAAAPFTFISTDEHGISTFGGDLADVTEGAYYAIYPAQEALSIDNGQINCVAIPTNQTLTENSFGRGNNTAVGFGPDCDNMMFYNVGGLAKIALVGNMSVASVTITNNAIADNKLSGRGTVSILSSHTVTDWGVSAVNYVTASAPNPSVGINVNGGKIFYITLPPCELSDYTVTITDIYGATASFDPAPVSISRSNVTYLGVFDATSAPNNNQLWYTNGNSTTPLELNASLGTLASNQVFENNHWVATFTTDLTTIAERAFQNNQLLLSVVLPASVTTIERYAFADCRNLASVSMPGVTTMGFAAFNNSGIISASLPQVTVLGAQAFYNCPNLASVTMPKVTIVDTCTFQACNNLASVTMPEAIVIRHYAFEHCTSLLSVTFPIATKIGTGAFGSCTSLQSVFVPEVTDVDSSAFFNCSNLVSVTMPAVTKIDFGAFNNCSRLNSVTIGPNIGSLGDGAFSNCSQLTIVKCYATNPPTSEEHTFINISSSAVLFVPTGSAANYSAWSSYFLGGINATL